MHFCWVTLPVKDLEASLAFYHGLLGLPIASRHSGHGTDMAMLGEKDQPKIELICLPGGQEEALHSGMTVGVATESLDSAMELLQKQRIPIARGPVSPAPHVRFLFVRDPDGYEVQLVEMKKA